MRVTQKGQVTIPLDIRRRAGFMPGTNVAIVMDGDAVKIVKAEEIAHEPSKRMKEFEDWLERVKGTGTSGLTTDEIMEITRGPWDDLDPGRL